MAGKKKKPTRSSRGFRRKVGLTSPWDIAPSKHSEHLQLPRLVVRDFGRRSPAECRQLGPLCLGLVAVLTHCLLT
jgi:hypothetical protein